MDALAIQGNNKLNGEVSTSGAKNSALPILFSALLAEGTHHFKNVPKLKDIDSTCELLKLLGCEVNKQENELTIKVGNLSSLKAEYDVVRKMRASILCLGPILTRFGEAQVSLPGGCAIGTRPIDLHLDGMKSLGAEVIVEAGYVNCKAKRLIGADIIFETATVGGTENLMMAASLAQGTTKLENAAKEPEIVDLANYLNKMGAKVSGAGTSVITIEGVDKLTPAEHDIIPDRIEAGTLLIAGAITGGEVTVKDCRPQDLSALINTMRDMGFKIETGDAWMQVKPCNSWSACDITTSPHPGFPTDLQAQYMSLATQAEGTSVITESIFENRFMHVQELVRLGADIVPKTRVAIVHGKKGSLIGAPVMATDLRASASLVLAGLVSKGETQVNRIYHLDRGYERLENKLNSLGAKIQRI